MLDHTALNQAGREPLPRSLRRHAGHRLTPSRRRSRVQPGPGVPRGRAEGRGGERADSTCEAGGDARCVRARRDQHPDQRDAARRGLELPAGDRRHAPGADRESPRLPAANAWHHAHAPAERGRDRRRLREQGVDPQRAGHLTHSLLGSDFYREGARVTPAPRRRPNRRARRKLSPAPWLVPVTPNVRPATIGHPARVAAGRPRYLDEDEQRYWASIAGRQVRFEERSEFVEKLTDGKASKVCLEQFLTTAAAENPNRRLRMMALADRVSMTVSGPTSTISSPSSLRPHPGRRTGCRDRASCPGRSAKEKPMRRNRSWPAGPGSSPGRRGRRRTARSARSSRRRSDCSAPWRSFAWSPPRGERGKPQGSGRATPIEVGAALLASAEGYTPKANRLIEDAAGGTGIAGRRRLCAGREPAAAETQTSRRRRRRRKKKSKGPEGAATPAQPSADGTAPNGQSPSKRRRRRKPRPVEPSSSDGTPAPTPARAAEA